MVDHFTPILQDAPSDADTINNPLYELSQAISNVGIIGPLNNFAAVIAPTVSDDDTQGYSKGSRWIDIVLDIGYECKDSTTGAALWDRTSPTNWAAPGDLGSTTPADVTYDTLLAIAATELTIATGAITVTQGSHTVDTEGDIASDDLITMNGGVADQYILLRAANTARTVVIKHSTGGAENIFTISGEDITLDNTEKAVFAYCDGTNWLVIGDGGSLATVTSVGLSATPAGIFDVSGSPVTTSGTLALAMDNQAANIVLSGPASGGAAEPSFRALVDDDIPGLDASKIDAGALAHERGGLEADIAAYTGVPRISGGVTSDVGTGTVSEFLRGDYTFAVPAGGGGGPVVSPNRLKSAIDDDQWAITTIDSTTLPPNSDFTPWFGRWIGLSEVDDAVDITRENTFLPDSGSQFYAELTITAAGANKKFGIMSVLSSDNSIPLQEAIVSLQAKLRTIAGLQTTWVRAAILEWSGTADDWTDPINVWGASGVDPTLTANWAYATGSPSINLGVGVDIWETRTLENITLGGSFTNLAVFFWLDDDNKGAGKLLQITQAQLEIDSVATAFVPLVREDYPEDAEKFRDSAKVLAGSSSILTALDANQVYSFTARQNPGVDGDTMSHSVYLQAGIYTLYVFGLTHTVAGIVDWLIDDVEVVSLQDWYGSVIFNVLKSSTVPILYDGEHTIKSFVHGKNGSSGGFSLFLTKIWLVKN